MMSQPPNPVLLVGKDDQKPLFLLPQESSRTKLKNMQMILYCGNEQFKANMKHI